MRTCSYCLRPQRGGYYRTEKGLYYCYDCYIRNKEKALGSQETHRQEYLDDNKAMESVHEQLRLLEVRIKDAGFQVRIYGGDYRVDNNAPSFVKDLVYEMNSLVQQKKSLLKRRRQTQPFDNDILTAKYFESEAEEESYLAEQEELRKKEEERRRAEEAEQKRLEAEKQKAEEEERRRKEAEQAAEEAERKRKEEERERKLREEKEATLKAYFRGIFASDFGQFGVRENVPVQELVGYAADEFKFYDDRPKRIYKAEWGRPYDFVLYEGGRVKGVVMLGDGHAHECNVKYLIARAYAQKLGVPYINFYIRCANERNYVIDRIKKFLNIRTSRSWWRRNK